MVGRMMGPKDVPVLIPGACEYVMIHGKEELNVRVKFANQLVN